jgi:hypothetical protein
MSSTRINKPLSARDLDTLRRLDARYGRQRFLDLIKSMPEPLSRRGPGAPSGPQLRPALFAALYGFAAAQQRTTISAFARELPAVLEIRFGRSVRNGPPNYSGPKKSATAIEQDIRRGTHSVKLVEEWILYLIWWRMNTVNPAWGFYAGGQQQHISVRPKRPERVIGWIDAAIDAAHLRQALEKMFPKRTNAVSIN